MEVLGYTQSGTDTGSNEKKQINSRPTQDAIPRAMYALSPSIPLESEHQLCMPSLHSP